MSSSQGLQPRVISQSKWETRPEQVEVTFPERRLRFRKIVRQRPRVTEVVVLASQIGSSGGSEARPF